MFLRLSEFTRNNFSKAVNELYSLTDFNNDQYPDYLKWFYNTNIPRILNNTGEVIFSIQNAKITDYEGLIHSKWGPWYKINAQFLAEKGYETFSCLNNERNQLSIFCGSFYTTSSQYEITLEYTKTTD